MRTIDSIHLHSGAATSSFDAMFDELCLKWMKAEPFDRGEVHAQKVTDPDMVTRELRDVVLDIRVPDSVLSWQAVVAPSLPWAEDHFLERVSGQPLNPPPAEAWWPYAQQGNAAHKEGDRFSHTYPERFWPKQAGEEMDMAWDIDAPEGRAHHGIRFAYGDLGDLVQALIKNPRTRQAYLPVWFPEDLAAVRQGQRVPCTLGYHIMMHPDGRLHMTYYMRSCDLVRFFRDDVYMAGRLLQWVTGKVQTAYGPNEDGEPEGGVGGVRLVISSLHAFEGDKTWINERAFGVIPRDKRAGYNFGALG